VGPVRALASSGSKARAARPWRAAIPARPQQRGSMPCLGSHGGARRGARHAWTAAVRHVGASSAALGNGCRCGGARRGEAMLGNK
jgi:hypothetical protein